LTGKIQEEDESEIEKSDIFIDVGDSRSGDGVPYRGAFGASIRGAFLHIESFIQQWIDTRCHWSYRHLVKKNTLCIGNIKKRYTTMLTTLLIDSNPFSSIHH